MTQESRLFLVYDDKDFADWIEEELSEYGRFIRKEDSLDFFFPQWEAIGATADAVILPEGVIKSDESFLRLYTRVKAGAPETIFLLIYYREKDHFIKRLESEGNVCISFNELDTGLLEQRLTEGKREPSQIQYTYPQDRQTDSGGRQEVKHVDSLSEDEQSQPATFAAVEKQQPEVLSETKEDIQETPATEGQQQLANPPVEREIFEETYEGIHAVDPQPKGSTFEQEQLKRRKTSEEQRLKLQRIKERIIIEEKIITVHVPVHFNSRLISIVSLYPRAGATFICSNFARMLGENKVPVAVIEPVLSHIGSTYYELMHGETNAPKDWISWPAQIQKSGYITQEKSWYTHGVNWIIANIEPTQMWNEELTMKLLLAANKFPITLCDISSHYEDPQCKKILSMSDEIWIVADGDPVQLNHHLHKIDALKDEYQGKQMKAIGNRWGDYIKQSEWKDAILLHTLTQIPDLGSVVLKHAWEGKLAWDDAKLKNTLSPPFKSMARTVVAKEIYALMKKEYGFGAKVRRIFNKLNSLEDETKTGKF